jgi:glucose-6-phosphate isomerase
MAIPTWLTAIFEPVSKIIARRQERKAAKETARAKLAQAALDNEHTLELNKDEYEIVATNGLADTWKDEYAVVSVVSILNLVVVGGLAAAFGYPQVLEGVAIAINSLTQSGVDVGFLLEAAVLSALGLSIWKKF